MLKVILSVLIFFNTALVCLAEDFTLDLKQGRNFISLPLSLSNPSLSEVFSSISGKYTNVWLHDSSTPADLWKHYHPDYLNFSDPISIEPGSAYWLETTEDCSLTVNGIPFNSSFSLDLKSGWNAFGWPYLESQPIEKVFDSLIFGTDYSRLCRFDSQSNSFQDYFNNPALDQFDTFQAGRAYYIYALGNHNVTFLPLPQVNIEEGDYTNNRDITLALSALSASQMIISEDSSFAGASWEGYVPSISFSLSAGDGLKTVYLKFKDEAGKETDTISDQINLDTVAPAIQIIAPLNGSEVVGTP